MFTYDDEKGSAAEGKTPEPDDLLNRILAWAKKKHEEATVGDRIHRTAAAKTMPLSSSCSSQITDSAELPCGSETDSIQRGPSSGLLLRLYSLTHLKACTCLRKLP